MNSVVIPADLLNFKPRFMPKTKTGLETMVYKKAGEEDDQKDG